MPALRDIETLHGALHPRHERRPHAELIHPEPQQKWNERDIAGHLAANADPNLIPMRRVRDHLEQTQHGRMCWLIEMSNLLVHPIHRQRVLNQIVRPDAEKIHLARQGVCGNGGTRYFDHGADLGLLPHGVPFPAQFRRAFL